RAGEAADAERVGHADAVDLDAHAVAGQAADREAARPEAVAAAGAAGDGDAGLVAHEIGDVVHLAAVDVERVDHADLARDVLLRAFGPRRGDHDAIELVDDAERRLRTGIEAVGMGESGERGQHGAGERSENHAVPGQQSIEATGWLGPGWRPFRSWRRWSGSCGADAAGGARRLLGEDQLVVARQAQAV